MPTVSAPPFSLVPRAPRQPTRRRRSGKPLRIESSNHLFFVTSRTRDSVFWLHPLLCSSLEPANREARRVIDAKRSRLDARLTRMLAAANKRKSARAASAAGARLPFLVACSGFASDLHKQRATAAGFDAHFSKPVDAVALVALLSTLA
jgi:hypothetical protein